MPNQSIEERQKGRTKMNTIEELNDAIRHTIEVLEDALRKLGQLDEHLVEAGQPRLDTVLEAMNQLAALRGYLILKIEPGQ
jgi:hypothetical protein